MNLPQDIWNLILYYVNPLHAYSSCSMICKMVHQILSSEKYYHFALEHLDMYQNSICKPCIGFLPSKNVILLRVQNMTWKSAFLQTIQRIQYKQQCWKQVYEKIQQKIEEDMVPFQNDGRSVGIWTNSARPSVAKHVGTLPMGFSRHPDEQPNEITMTFSVPQYAKQMEALRNEFTENLFCVEPSEQTYQGLLVMYHKFMILSVKYPDLFLVPMNYVCAAWYSHLIRPAQYHQYCKQLIAKYGKPEHENIFKQRNHLIPCNFYLTELQIAILDQAWKQTIKLWQLEFNEPMIPEQFEIPTVRASKDPYYIGSESEMCLADLRYLQISFHVVFEDFYDRGKAIQKHHRNVNSYFAQLGELTVLEISITGAMIAKDLQFFTDFATHWHEQNSTIYEKEYPSLIKSYERYLFLRCKYPDASIAAPSPYIQLAWLMHMCNPISYYADVCCIFHCKVSHHVPEYDFVMHDDALWNKEFGTKLHNDHTYAMIAKN